MTMLFKQVFECLSDSCSIPFLHCNSDISLFLEQMNQGAPQFLSVNNVEVPLDQISDPFVGSHIIRDPRDLVVSGYRYHLRCDEQWTRCPLDDSMRTRLGVQQLGCSEEAKTCSFQELLNAVDQETGLMLELNWRRPHFEQMQNWDYSRPEIMEIKYEEVFGNESTVFSRLFEHYGLGSRITAPAKRRIRDISFSNLQKRGQTGHSQHASVGVPSQWKEFLPAILVQEFKTRHGNLLIKLGYENAENW